MPENLSRKLGTDVPVWAWLIEPLQGDVRTQLRRLARAPDVRRIAVMPDVHLAADVCVGVVLATEASVYPQAVGGDIGCGISAVRLVGSDSVDLAAMPPSNVLRCLQQAAPILRRLPDTPGVVVEPPPASELGDPGLRREADRTGRVELGTLGRGNHFLELQHAGDGTLWLVVHSGSRAMGQAVRDHHLRNATRAGGGLLRLDAAAEAGRSYLRDAEWCVRYASANRASMLHAASHLLADELGLHADWAACFGTSHNFARQERHGSDEFNVHRKGAGDASLDTRSIIPGSMGGETHFVTGRGAARSLASSSHGAGRCKSREHARRTIGLAALASQIRETHVDPALLPRLVEEAPGAYKDLRQVMRAQHDLIRIDNTLTTLVCHKGV